MFLTAPKGACTPPVTSFRNTSKLDTLFSWMTMRRPGKKGSPLRYTSTLFTVGCESHDALAPGLVMLPVPGSLRCPGRPHLFAGERLLPGNPSGPDTAPAGPRAHLPGSDRASPGLGTALQPVHSLYTALQPVRSLYTALQPVHSSVACAQRLLPGNQRAAPGARRAWSGERQARRKNAAWQHSRDTDWRGPAASGTFIPRLCHEGKPHRPAFLGKVNPGVLPGARPAQTPRHGGRGAACPEGERGPRGRDPNEGERKTPALPPPARPTCPHKGRGSGGSGETPRRPHRTLGHPGDEKPENLRESKTKVPSIQI